MIYDPSKIRTNVIHNYLTVYNTISFHIKAIVNFQKKHVVPPIAISCPFLSRKTKADYLLYFIIEVIHIFIYTYLTEQVVVPYTTRIFKVLIKIKSYRASGSLYTPAVIIPHATSRLLLPISLLLQKLLYLRIRPHTRGIFRS